MPKKKGVPLLDAITEFGLDRLKRAGGDAFYNWNRRGVPQGTVADLRREDAAAGTRAHHGPAPISVPPHLQDELQRKRTFTMIVEGLASLEDRAFKGDKAAQEAMDKAWNALQAVRPFIERQVGWTDEHWRHLLVTKPRDKWKQFMKKHSEDEVDALLTEFRAARQRALDALQ